MEITRLDNQTLRISQLDPLSRELLERIVSSADPAGSEAAQERLFSRPTEEAEKPDFVEDWREYVEPGLRQHFQSSLEVIAEDLSSMQPGDAEGESVLTIPPRPSGKLDSRIEPGAACARRPPFHQRRRDGPRPAALRRPRALALLQIRFTAFLQELFLQEVERGEGNGGVGVVGLGSARASRASEGAPAFAHLPERVRLA